MLDAFHVTALGMKAVDEVRRRVQQTTLGQQGHKGDPLYEIRRLLRRRADRLTAEALARPGQPGVSTVPGGQLAGLGRWWWHRSTGLAVRALQVARPPRLPGRGRGGGRSL